MKINKQKLIDFVQGQLDKEKADRAVKLEKYKGDTIKWLKKNLKDAEAGLEVDIQSNIRPPKNREPQYLNLLNTLNRANADSEVFISVDSKRVPLKFK